MTKKETYKICISGGSKGENAKNALDLARQVGEAVAKKGHVLISGATSGVPYAAALAAKKAGGSTIGFSPAGSKIEHAKKYRLPESDKVFDHIIYTEFGYTGRNLMMIRSADATVVIDGRMGTLNEFSSAFEENEVIGVLEGSGGIADEVRRLLEVAKKGRRKVVFGREPVKLIEKVIAKIEEEKKQR
jgi:uncharacterized protein (TIGR00725 family)